MDTTDETIQETPPASPQAGPSGPVQATPGKDASPTVDLPLDALWMCKNGHALGVRMPYRGIMRLIPFRYAVQVPEVTEGVNGIRLSAYLLLGYIDSAQKWPCSMCGARKDWEPSGAFVQAMKRRK